MVPREVRCEEVKLTGGLLGSTCGLSLRCAASRRYFTAPNRKPSTPFPSQKLIISWNLTIKSQKCFKQPFILLQRKKTSVNTLSKNAGAVIQTHTRINCPMCNQKINTHYYTDYTGLIYNGQDKAENNIEFHASQWEKKTSKWRHITKSIYMAA